eukprot:5375731-Amphidinium_carterae.1
MHRWVFHRAIWTCGFALGYLCGYIEGATGNDGDNDSDSDNVVIVARTMPCESSATLRNYRDNDNTNGMFGKMNVNQCLHHSMPETHQFREWSGDVKVYLTVHNVHIEEYMDESAKDNKYPTQPTEDEADELEDHIEITMSIRKKMRSDQSH